MTKCERRFARYSKRQLKKHNIRVFGCKLKFTSKNGIILDDIENDKLSSDGNIITFDIKACDDDKNTLSYDIVSSTNYSD